MDVCNKKLNFNLVQCVCNGLWLVNLVWYLLLPIKRFSSYNILRCCWKCCKLNLSRSIIQQLNRKAFISMIIGNLGLFLISKQVLKKSWKCGNCIVKKGTRKMWVEDPKLSSNHLRHLHLNLLMRKLINNNWAKLKS